jgi:hypothetical protein
MQVNPKIDSSQKPVEIPQAAAIEEGKNFFAVFAPTFGFFGIVT